MSHLERAAYEGVQAALLESECHPRAAVQNALQAVAEFSFGEDVTETLEEFQALVKKAWEERKLL